VANEVTIPLLPCRDIDDIADFYRVLGFTQTYRQTKPNPYISLQREGIALHFFGMPGFDPADSYGSCLVIVPDTGELFDAFAAGMRERYGKLLVSGIPRMTRPRKKQDGHTGFSVIDPGGNWIRIFNAAEDSDEMPTGKLAKALHNAVVLADSKGDEQQAAKILDGALARETDAPAADRAAALEFRAELAVRLGESDAELD
jgi:catechol 2,3-dioxygenase-like lactoylglutathione lyase family enzyme